MLDGQLHWRPTYRQFPSVSCWPTLEETCSSSAAREFPSRRAYPDFRQLVLDVYGTLDPSVYEVLTKATNQTCRPPKPDPSALTDRQTAEVKRFIAREYDVVLGMLERRLDGLTREDSEVRNRVAELLRSSRDSRCSATGGMEADSDDADRPRANRPAPIHRTLIRLADRGGTTTIMTTNFDLLLESAARRLRVPAQSYALGSIP